VTRHRYPPAALAGDYARAGAGLALTLPPLALLQLNPVVATVFALLAVLFVVFAWRTLVRQLGAIEVSESEIRARGPFPVGIAWGALDEIKLGYYATRRDGSSGWMQLVLRAGRRRLRLDSRIEGFAAIAARAASAARQRRLALGDATVNNLAALGVTSVTAEE
jgi:hypothetical protein